MKVLYNESINNKHNQRFIRNNQPLQNHISTQNSLLLDHLNFLAILGSSSLINNKLSFGKSSVIPNFEDTVGEYFYPYTPDEYQLEAAKNIHAGLNTMVTAPTGTGKTLIAEYAIKNNMDLGKRTFYTTPLKALTNDKYREFCKRFGAENVGIMTGDIKHNTSAPIIIMTTEIYRNMLLSGSDEEVDSKLRNVKTVVYDEFHYMNDKDRGLVWEEAIALSSRHRHLQQLPLSATVGNASEITEWMNSLNPTRATKLVEVPSANRHVPLFFHAFVNSSLLPLMTDKVHLDSFYKETRHYPEAQNAFSIIGKKIRKKEDAQQGYYALKDALKNEFQGKQEISRLDFIKYLQKYTFTVTEISQILTAFFKRRMNENIPKANDRAKTEKTKLGFEVDKIIDTLQKEDKLPAIVFIFSKKDCNLAVSEYLNTGKTLLTPQEVKRVKAIIEKYTNNNVFLGEEFNEFSELALSRGVAPLHAGILPGYKSLIEELFKEKLIKAVFSTETLAAGINMPARSVVITSIQKPSGEMFEDGSPVTRKLTTNEFQQMSGRAGRRGIDTLGHVIILDESQEILANAFELAINEPNIIKSNFKPSYNIMLNMLRNTGSFDSLNRVIEDSFSLHGIEGDKKLSTMSYFQSKFNSLINRSIWL